MNESTRLHKPTPEELGAVAGAMMNPYPDGQRPMKPAQLESGHGLGYFLPEMEFDVGIRYLP
jgi:hypothetical protein